jgi:hypothetical protein
MRTVLITMSALAAMTAAGTARADQCAIISPEVARKATALVARGATVVEMCEPCGDTAPSKPVTVTTAEVKRSELVINGKGKDLAYLYVETGPGEFKNVGLMTSCGAARVSETIRNGKPSGPVATRPPPRPTAPPPPRPTAPPPPRATSPSDFTGTWEVTVMKSYSTCSGRSDRSPGTWNAQVTGDTLRLRTAAGEELWGAIDASHNGPFKAVLKPSRRPSSAALETSMFLKDRFFARYTRAHLRGGNSGGADPICIVHQDLAARRK